jgi:hypothetical protein
VFIYFAITIYITTWASGQMVKALGCGWGGEGSNFILDMFANDFIMMTYCRFAKLRKERFKQKKDSIV